MARHLANWLDGYVQYTQETESPTVFHQWCGITALAAVLSDRVRYNQSAYMVYPHLYTILVAESGRVRKSTAIRIACKLIKEANVTGMKIISDAATPEALVHEIAVQAAATKQLTRILIDGSELVVMLKSDQARRGETRNILHILTKLYDHEYPYTHSTKTRGVDTITHGAVCLLGATTEAWLRDMFPPSAAQGGFIPRCIFVKATKASVTKILPYPLLNDAPLRKGLLADLKAIAALAGEAKASEDGRVWYEKWYTGPFQKLVADAETPDTEGFYGRYQVYVEKLALLMSVCESNDLIIRARHFQRAATLMVDVEQRQHLVTEAVARTEWADMQRQVYDHIWQHGGFAPLGDITEHFQRRMRAKQLQEDVLTPLCQMGKLAYAQGPHPKTKHLVNGYRLVAPMAAYPGSPSAVAALRPPEPEAPRQDETSRQES